MPILKINGEDIAWGKNPETGEYEVYKVTIDKKVTITPQILTAIIEYEKKNERENLA